MSKMNPLILCFLVMNIAGFAQSNENRGTIKIKKPECSREKSSDIYEMVDDMPMFPGGVDNLNAWMNDNLVYPAGAKRAGVTAKIFVSFIVMPDGSFADTKIVKGGEKEFEIETMRLLIKMPKWNVGKCNGAVVPVRITMPVKFDLK